MNIIYSKELSKYKTLSKLCFVEGGTISTFEGSSYMLVSSLEDVSLIANDTRIHTQLDTNRER